MPIWSGLGKPLAALRDALKKNTALHDLATTPLMLNILILDLSRNVCAWPVQ